MNKKEFSDSLKRIKENEKKYNVKIDITDIIDYEHLDCSFYGGEVGSITFPDGAIIVIETFGEIRLCGIIDNKPVEIVDKANQGIFKKSDIQLTDSLLDKLLNSADSSNYLAFGNNNWFQANLITPSGEWIDLTETDNILSDNLLECFENIERIIALKNWGYPTVKFISYSGEYPNLCSGDLVLEINGEIVTFEKYSYSMCSTGSIKYNNEFDDYETSKGPWKVELPQEYNYLDEIVTALVNENVPWGCCGGCIL